MIKKTRISSLRPYLGLIPTTKNVYVGVLKPSEVRLKDAGFGANATDGETILPRPRGKASEYNANGREVVHRDQPLETAYRTVDWHWTEYHGPYRVEQHDFRDVPYKRYPRTFEPAPAVELTLFTDTNGNQTVLTGLIGDWQTYPDRLIHAVNLMLDLFGECTFYDESRQQILKAPIRRLNWKTLPRGRYPFSALRKELNEALAQVKPGNREFADRRLDRVNSYGPDFVAVGLNGFSGYVVFGFPERNIFVLESVLYGNATYVLGEDWEKLSKMTKAEILDNKLHQERIIHRRSWFEKIKKLLA